MSPSWQRRCAAVTLAVTTGAAAVGCAAEPTPQPTVRSFLLEWQNGEFEAAARHTTGDPDEVATALREFNDHLDLAALRLSLAPIERDGDTATAGFEAQADLGIGDPVWTFSGEMPLRRVDGTWLIDWSPSVMHPELDEGERLAVTYDVPDRGQVFDRDDDPLVTETEVVAIGALPAEMPDIDEAIGELADLLGADPGPYLDRVRSAPPDEFQPLALLAAGEADRGLLRQAAAIPGIETTESEMPLDAAVAPAILGEVAGTHERDVADLISGPYQAGDTVGLSALQAVYQQRLAGTATTRVVTLDGDGEQSNVLEEWPGEASGTLSTTLDTTLQETAEEVLATESFTAHLVAVEVGSGDILAAASHPGDPGNDGALTAGYLPGTAFTLVSAAALLESGAASPETAAACPPETTVGERTFSYAGQPIWGEPTLTENFANACVTALVELSSELSTADLEETAADLGIGAQWRLPLAANPGELGDPGDEGELAATVVGADGADLEVSPLSMALVAAAIADGTWRSPELVTEAEQEPVPDVELSADTVQGVREMMRATVEQGVAVQANVGAVPVHGQVGVAEQRVGDEDVVVQWFVGFQGDLAFAVAVELPQQVAHQYAVGFASDLLQRLPDGYVEPLPGDAEEAGEGEAADADEGLVGEGD